MLPESARNKLSECRNYPFTLGKRAPPLEYQGRYKTCVGVMDMDTLVCAKQLTEAKGAPWLEKPKQDKPFSVIGTTES